MVIMVEILETLKSLCGNFPHALLAGCMIAMVCTLLGIYTLLKRVVFVGITLSEVAACGIAAAMMFNVPAYIGAAALTLTTVAVLAYPFEMIRIPRDAVLGVIFVAASSMSILLVSKSGFGLHEVTALLYGDLILTSPQDLKIILPILLPVLICFFIFLRPTLYTFVDREASQLLGIRTRRWELLYFLSLGLTVSSSTKVAGALLIFCYLVVAPAAALLLSRRFWLVISLALGGSLISTFWGMYLSFSHDLPTNQTIAVVTCTFFVLALVSIRVKKIFMHRALTNS